MILLATAILMEGSTDIDQAQVRQPDSRPYAQSAGPLLHAEPWAEADRLFFNNPDTPEWKGADVANSVAVDDNRILWVFGDTLLAEPGVNACDRFGTFDIALHNSLALQVVADDRGALLIRGLGRPDTIDLAELDLDGGFTSAAGHALDREGRGDGALVAFRGQRNPNAAQVERRQDEDERDGSDRKLPLHGCYFSGVGLRRARTRSRGT